VGSLGDVSQAVPMHRHRARPTSQRPAFAGFHFPAEVITVAVPCYLRYGLSYRNVEELLAERGVEVDHVAVFRWVQRFTPLFADAARRSRHAVGCRECRPGSATCGYLHSLITPPSRLRRWTTRSTSGGGGAIRPAAEGRFARRRV
jgi:hypothetical protein